jgi:hypothetical protein
MLRWLFKKLFYRERKRLLDTIANREAVIRRYRASNVIMREKMNGAFRESKNLVHALELLREKNNYVAAIELLAIREEQLGELLRRPTQRPLDGAKAPRKSKRSTGSPRK